MDRPNDDTGVFGCFMICCLIGLLVVSFFARKDKQGDVRGVEERLTAVEKRLDELTIKVEKETHD